MSSPAHSTSGRRACIPTIAIGHCGPSQAYLAHPARDFELETRLRHKDGSYRHILARASLIRDDAGVPTHMLGSHVDITRYAELHAQFLQSQKMDVVGQLAGGVAHDFNNLLTVINGTVDLLLTDLRAGDPMRPDLVQIRDAGDRATSLTRITRGQVRLEPAPTSIGAVLSDAVEGVRPAAEARRIALEVDIDPAAGMVMADSTRLQQVFWNLLTNAVKFTGQGGRTVASVRRLGEDEVGHVCRSGRHVSQCSGVGMCGFRPATRQDPGGTPKIGPHSCDKEEA